LLTGRSPNSPIFTRLSPYSIIDKFYIGKSTVLGSDSKMDKIATIKISSEARDRLRALKKGGESYDAVIRRLIEGEEK